MTDVEGVMGAPERRTSPVELIWDLVFAFAVTQVAALLSRDLSWAGLGRSMLVLALIWWAWSAFVWAANAAQGRALVAPVLLFGVMLVFLAGLAIPHAFGNGAVLFASAYACVRLLHLALYANAARRGDASGRAIGGFAVTVIAGMLLLVCGAALGGSAQDVLWTLAVAIDYAGPGLLTRRSLRGLQEVAVAHFAERYGLFILICLGESVAAVGEGANGRPLSFHLVLAGALGIAITLALWWSYFARFADSGERRLREHEDPVLAASDAYSYLHLLLVAGIIIFAVGIRLAIRDASSPLSEAGRLALCGGIALYLLGQLASRLRLSREPGPERLLAALALTALAIAGSSLAAWRLAALAAAILVLACLGEARRGIAAAVG